MKQLALALIFVTFATKAHSIPEPMDEPLIEQIRVISDEIGEVRLYRRLWSINVQDELRRRFPHSQFKKSTFTIAAFETAVCGYLKINHEYTFTRFVSEGPSFPVTMETDAANQDERFAFVDLWWERCGP